MSSILLTWLNHFCLFMYYVNFFFRLGLLCFFYLLCVSLTSSLLSLVFLYPFMFNVQVSQLYIGDGTAKMPYTCSLNCLRTKSAFKIFFFRVPSIWNSHNFFKLCPFRLHVKCYIPNTLNASTGPTEWNKSSQKLLSSCVLCFWSNDNWWGKGKVVPVLN
jgi:hypothetical protein